MGSAKNSQTKGRDRVAGDVVKLCVFCMNKNALIYCRVSTEEQAREGFSLDAQERFCRSYAEQNGFRIIGTYRDEGKSGTTLDRPALKDVLERCQKENPIDAVLVQETDRLARNTKDHLTIKAILKKAGVKLISVAQPMLDDSPEGNMIDTILASVNQFQSDINGRKIKKGHQEKFEEGWWPGWAPLGYRNVTLEENAGDRKARRIIEEDPIQWTLLKEGFNLYLSGNYSIDEIRDILTEKGFRSKYGKKISHSIMAYTIRNPFYAGIMQWNGQERVGNHKPMISIQEHKRILQIISAHNLNACRRRKHDFILRGFMFCKICGQRYTAEKHPSKNKAYYRCATMMGHSNRGQNVEVARLEHEVEERFKGIEFSQEFINLVVTKVKAMYQMRRDELGTQKQALQNQKIALEKKRDIIEAKLFSGVISDDDFARNRAKLKGELEQIQNQIDDLDCQREFDIDVIEEVLKLTRNVHKAYTEASGDLKRQYLALFWEKFLVQDKKIVDAISTKCIQVLLKKRKVLIKSKTSSSPSLNRTLLNLLSDWSYWAKIKEKLSAIKACEPSVSLGG